MTTKTERFEFSDGAYYIEMPVCQFASCTWFVAANEVYCERHRDETDRDEANQAAYDDWNADQQAMHEEMRTAEERDAEDRLTVYDGLPFE